VIDWSAPNNRGSVITGYRVYIRQNDLAYTLDLTHCNGAGSTIIAATLCTIPILTLRSEPYNLPYGSSIYAKLYAYNIYGDSLVSTEGNGALILTNPDAPITLVEDYSQRTATALAISWSKGASNGGTTILDYTISYDQGTGTYVVLSSGVLE
jgi:hypothetical protein